MKKAVLSVRYAGGILVCVLLVLSSGAIAWADAPAVNPTAQADPLVHIVQWGENLTWIAARYGTTVQAIMAANGLANSNRIYAGQRLIIPATVSSPAPATGSVYVVRYGDTLSGIAYQFGVSINALVQANRLLNPNCIYAGQRLAIPGAAPAPAPQTQPSNDYTWYVVQRGDTLAKIAVRFGVRIWDIVMANHIANPNLIVVGQRLCIPKACTSSSCQPAQPQAPVVSSNPGCDHLTWPKNGARLSGIVKVSGTAKIDNMWYYKLEYRKDGLDDWHYLTGAEKAVVKGLLGMWDTRQVSNGRYTFRLVMVDWTGNYPPPCEIYVTVNNR